VLASALLGFPPTPVRTTLGIDDVTRRA